MLEVIGALIPPASVALLFWFIVRAMVHADRRERTAMARLDRLDREQEQQGRSGGDPAEKPGTPGTEDGRGNPE